MYNASYGTVQCILSKNTHLTALTTTILAVADLLALAASIEAQNTAVLLPTTVPKYQYPQKHHTHQNNLQWVHQQHQQKRSEITKAT